MEQIETKGNEVVKRRKRRDWGAIIFVVGMLLIPLAHFTVFWLFVNVDSIFLSFKNFNMTTGKWDWVGFANYKELYVRFVREGSVLPRALLNSFTVFLWNDLVIIPISLFCAYMLYKKMPLGNAFKIIFFLPSIISVVVLTLAYQYILNMSVPELFEKLKLDHLIPFAGYFGDPNWAWWTVLVYGLWSGIGGNIVLISGAMSRIPTEVLEAGKLDGLSMIKELWHIVIPLIGSTIGTLLLMGTAVIFSYFLQPKLLLGESAEAVGGFTIAMYIVNNVRDNGTVQMAMGATIGVICAIVGTPIVLLAKKLLEKLFPVYEY